MENKARQFKTKDARLQAAFICMEIQEDETIMKGRSTFKGYAQLQRVIEYLVNTEVAQ